MRGRKRWVVSIAAAGLATALLGWGSASAGSPAAATSGKRSPIQHVVEIMLENHTFDNLFGSFAGANGIPAGTLLPNPSTNYVSAPVSPMPAPPNVGDTVDLNHNRAAEIEAMDYRPAVLAGGTGFFTVATPSNSFLAGPPGWRMDYYTTLPTNGLASITTFGRGVEPNLWDLAQHFVLADTNFQPAIGPTQPNRIYAVAGSADAWISDSPPVSGSFPLRTVFDELTHHGLSWGIFQGDYNGPPPTPEGNGFVTHWNPAWYTPILQDKHLWNDVANTSRFITEVENDQLPNFSFVVPTWLYSEHPPTDIQLGDAWVGQLVSAIEHSAEWRTTAIFITYDEGGGFWDHVAPPIASRFGYGTRTPMVVISPWVRPGIFHAQTTNMSILAFMDRLWGMRPLTGLVARQNDLLGMFRFSGAPIAPMALPNVPQDTIQVADQAESLTASPGQPLVVNVEAKTAGLTTDTGAVGAVALRVVGPEGAPNASYPKSVDLVDGTAQATLTFPTPGYWRVVAAGPNGAEGWATFDVGVNDDSMP
jgi:phospholipase C